MASPLVLVSDSGPFVPTVGGVNIAAGATVSIKLADTTDVVKWFLQVSGTDELSTAPVLTGVNPSTNQVTTPVTVVTFSNPSAHGRTLLFVTTVQDATTTTADTFGLYTLTTFSTRIPAADEELQASPTFGWATILNPYLRAGALALQGVQIDSTAPTTGYFLGFDGTKWTSLAVPPGFAAGGDLSGSSTLQHVIGVQGVPVDPTTPTTGQLFGFNGTAWIPTTLPPGITSNYQWDDSVPAAENSYQTLAAVFSAITTSGVKGDVDIFVGINCSGIVSAGTYDFQLRTRLTTWFQAMSVVIGNGVTFSNMNVMSNVNLVVNGTGAFDYTPGLTVGWFFDDTFITGDPSMGGPALTLNDGLSHWVSFRGNFAGMSANAGKPIILVDGSTTLSVNLEAGATLYTMAIQGTGTLNIIYDVLTQVQGDLVAGGFTGTITYQPRAGGTTAQVVLGNGGLGDLPGSSIGVETIPFINTGTYVVSAASATKNMIVIQGGNPSDGHQDIVLPTQAGRTYALLIKADVGYGGFNIKTATGTGTNVRASSASPGYLVVGCDGTDYFSLSTLDHVQANGYKFSHGQYGYPTLGYVARDMPSYNTGLADEEHEVIEITGTWAFTGLNDAPAGTRYLMVNNASVPLQIGSITIAVGAAEWIVKDQFGNYRMTAGGSGGFTAGGDLSGSNTSQTVSKIQGVTISGTPAVGSTLVATSTTAAAWTGTSVLKPTTDLTVPAARNTLVRASWTGTSHTITTPSSPSQGDVIAIQGSSDAALHPTHIALGGGKHANGSASVPDIVANYGWVVLIYDGTEWAY